MAVCNDKISIIIPVYKVENYLHRCVDSVLNQTYTNLEIILVNDGSPDRSGEMCNEYVKKDSRIKALHKENGGQSSARNMALDIATGDWILFIDSDDFVSPFYAEHMIDCAIRTGCDIVQCGYSRFYSGEDMESIQSAKGKETLQIRDEVMRLIQSHEYIFPWNKIYKRYLWKDIRFPIGIIHEDNATMYKVYDLVDRICLLDEKLYFYYYNLDSTMTGKIKNAKLGLLDAYAEQAEFFKKHGEYDCYKTSSDLLAACFGTFTTYKKEQCVDYDAFCTGLQKKYQELRPLLLTLPLRLDLKLLVSACKESLSFMRFFYNLKKTVLFWKK